MPVENPPNSSREIAEHSLDSEREGNPLVVVKLSSGSFVMLPGNIVIHRRPIGVLHKAVVLCVLFPCTWNECLCHIANQQHEAMSAE